MATPKQKREKPVFARNLISKRKSLGLSAHALAAKARVPYPTLRDIEAGYNRGRDDTKEALASALGCSLGDLYADAVAAQVRPTDKLIKLLVESPAEAPLKIVGPLLEEFVRCGAWQRAGMLAILFDDESISERFS